MLEDFQNIELFPVDLFKIIGGVIVALICGFTISVVYRITYKGPSYSVSFVNSIIILSMITSIVILVIGNNLATAFGLVGAMSIIRFRTAVRDVQDIVFIFFSLSVGMAAGVGLYAVAVAGTILVSLVIIILFASNYGKGPKKEFLLQLAYAGGDENEIIVGEILKKHCKKLKLINLKNIGHENDLEAYYHVSLKQVEKSSDLVNDLSKSEKIKSVNLYFDEDDANPPTY